MTSGALNRLFKRGDWVFAAPQQLQRGGQTVLSESDSYR